MRNNTGSLSHDFKGKGILVHCEKDMDVVREAYASGFKNGVWQERQRLSQKPPKSKGKKES